MFLSGLRRFQQSALSRCVDIGNRYASFSQRRPYTCSSLTAFGVLGVADITAQQICLRPEQSHNPDTGVENHLSWRERVEKHDWQRTFALTAWGTFHYGFPQKKLYVLLDRVLGPGKAATKTFVDVCLNIPFHLIPSFYLFTGVLKHHPAFDLRGAYGYGYAKAEGERGQREDAELIDYS